MNNMSASHLSQFEHFTSLNGVKFSVYQDGVESMKQETGQLISSIDKMVICMLYKYTQFQFNANLQWAQQLLPLQIQDVPQCGRPLSHNNVPVLYLQSAGHVIGCSVDKALPWALARIRVLCAASLPPAARESLFGATQHLAFQASEMRILNPNCLLQHLPLTQSSPFILLVN